MLGAIAFPAFREYMEQGQPIAGELSLQLEDLGKHLERVRIETGSFPIGDTELTPPGTCCGQRENKCQVDAVAIANDPIWKQIGFALDRPTPYQFRYHCDGRTAIVMASADTDRDGIKANYTLRMSGAPKIGTAGFVIDGPRPRTY